MYKHIHIPDLVLEVESPEKGLYLIVFDAKYRLTRKGELPEGVLADAYTYLGSIGFASGKRAVQASLLLYPGQNMPEYYSSGVGVVPCLPGATQFLCQWLEATLQLPR